MYIRLFRLEDTEQLVQLFYETVHTVNALHYSPEQLNVWAPIERKNELVTRWREELAHRITYVAVLDDHIAGFSDMTDTGDLDRLYVHKDMQGRGVASALLNALEKKAVEQSITDILAEVSITAKPFFDRHGFQILEEQKVLRAGVFLTNYRMMKRLRSQ
ncbi:GNAT family N-acetyltransferase [Paenibacillus sp. Marseille-Q4541]|uniref:GNAT family N-acetyltransferase n=1 Tax=Paenibacillus sp. Marseille-Q4541 TaxID=2831522 RepID=UPI001BA4DB10|nr:GNAT family N-acetyltransferase [Paenibacillus sp. Marseille-Q4541]